MSNKPMSYCNTCRHFPLEESMANAGRGQCEPFATTAEWDDRACVLYTAVSVSERANRKPLVVKLYQQKQQQTT